MMSNYPEGSMRGSGIYSFERDEDFICATDGCDFDGVVTAYVDDWGTANIECPTCGREEQRESN